MKKVLVSESQLCSLLGAKASEFYAAEKQIDEHIPVYLMTWSPDPKKLPDCDFINQHIWAVEYVQTYLMFCAAGAACVESTQLGNPHYHFWYQLAEDNREEGRIRWVKIMQKVGNVKVTKALHYKKNKWYSKGNALWYYKKESIDAQLRTPCNPVTAETALVKVDYTDYNWFFHSGRSTAAKCFEKASEVKLLEEFYKKSF